MVKDREEVKIVKKAEELQNKEKYCEKELKQLQEKWGKLQRKLFLSEHHKEFLKDDLQQAKDMINKRDKVTDSLQHQLSGLGEARG